MKLTKKWAKLLLRIKTGRSPYLAKQGADGAKLLLRIKIGRSPYLTAKLLHRIKKGVGGSPPHTVQVLGCRKASPIGPG